MPHSLFKCRCVQSHRMCYTAPVMFGWVLWVYGLRAVLSSDQGYELAYSGRTLYRLKDLECTKFPGLTGLCPSSSSGWILHKLPRNQSCIMVDTDSWEHQSGLVVRSGQSRYSSQVFQMVYYNYLPCPVEVQSRTQGHQVSLFRNQIRQKFTLSYMDGWKHPSSADKGTVWLLCLGATVSGASGWDTNIPRNSGYSFLKQG